MTRDSLNVEDWGQPGRDGRGRFSKGTSGNPYGRPRKRSPVPWSYESSFTAALAELVSVTGPDGTAEKLAIRELLIKTFVRSALKAKPRDQLLIIERLANLNVLAPTAEELEPEQGIFTEEDRRLMEIVEREFLPLIYCQCEKPIFRGSEQDPERGDFAFD